MLLEDNPTSDRVESPARPACTAKRAAAAHRRAIVAAHATPSDGIALWQLATTLVPLALLWVAVPILASVSPWLVAGLVLPMSLLLLRVFVLMHDCGHHSLFRSARANRIVGFGLGVIAGMPQYVWSKHHAFHHATNGDWSKYRGPLAIVCTDTYAAMTVPQRKRYRRARSIVLAPIAGFLYLIVTPRTTWVKGSLALLRHVVTGRRAEPGVPVADLIAGFRTTLWTSPREFRHMTWNNLAVLAGWAAMAWALGPILFFALYFAAIALAGGAALVLFSVQHNFEHSYASDTLAWSHDDAAVHGTSFLVLPGWLNWFTADIAYHHAHHLSANIPNYRLARCHAECADLFTEVTRLRLAQVPAALRCILWDIRARRIVSVAEAMAGR